MVNVKFHTVDEVNEQLTSRFNDLAFKNYNTTAFAFCAIMAILGFIVVIWNIYKSIEIRKK